MVRPGENILLDADLLWVPWPTAHELRGCDKLSVTTPGVNTMHELVDSEGIEVDCLSAGRAASAELRWAAGRGGPGTDEP